MNLAKLDKETLRTLIADGLISLDEVLLQFSAQE